jgi:tetratricopeptide (TPR) repeat protein
MLQHPRLIRFCLIIVLLLSTVPRASFAEKPQVWIRVRSPNFIVVTNGSEKQARRVAYQFEMIRAVLCRFLNFQGPATDPPVIIIAARDEASFKPLLPEAYQAKGATQLGGIYVGGPEKNYVALRLDLSLDREASAPFETVYHEYVHYLMRRSISVIPLWLTEGLAEFYGNLRLETKYVLLGAPSALNLMVLRQTPLLPLNTLFAVNASSPYYHENNKASIFYAESWVLTHYLMTKDWRDKTDRLRQFVALLGENKSAEDAAKPTIGDPQALEEALRGYIGRFSFTVARVTTPAEVNEDSFTPDPISEAESLAVRADFMVHARSYPKARQMLEESLKLDPKLAAAYESMGQLYAQQNQFDEANKWYSQAVALNSQSYLANFYYATNLFKGNLDDDLAAKAESSLRTAIMNNSAFAPAYDALAYLLATRHRGLVEARLLALQAVNLEPGNIRYRLRMVQVLEQMGRADDAVRVATLTSSLAKTPEDWTEAQGALNSAQRLQEFQQRFHQREEGLKKTPAEGTGLIQAERGDSAARPSAEAQSPGAEPPSDETQPTVLRHRDVATANGPANPAPASQAPAPRQRPELLARREVADGAITDSKCPDSVTLELTLTSRAGSRQLYSDNYYKIPFSALNFTPKGVLNPCSDLKGMRAHITYHPAKDHPEQGEIVEVQLMK